MSTPVPSLSRRAFVGTGRPWGVLGWLSHVEEPDGACRRRTGALRNTSVPGGRLSSVDPLVGGGGAGGGAGGGKLRGRGAMRRGMERAEEGREEGWSCERALEAAERHLAAPHDG